ncbi:hemicentin-1 [Hippocampus comes]|uniref:hemicentin-1 n=1 Tax=Hippocampus comes TaxID=109280 RepID=UPI00094F2FC3|nr:PREDICTED: hemicentin-1-like [Hippocampus comes]XP_019717666.1 PREDICTED: hemicentin-1-like [Hippocampus comes]
MTMASAGFIFLLLLMVSVSLQNASDAFIQVDCKKENSGQYGQQSVVECVIRKSEEVKDLTVSRVVWKKDGLILLEVHNNQPRSMAGYSFAEPSWNNKSLNVSLLIANTAVANHGNYSCMVMTDSGLDNKSTSLRVTAKYGKPSIHTTAANTTPSSQVTLTCRSQGGHPKGQLSWFEAPNGQLVGNVETAAEVMPNGLFSLSSELTLPSGRDASNYTCVVRNARGGKDDEVTGTIPNAGHVKGLGQDPKAKNTDLATKVVAPLIVIGSMIVGLLFLVFWKKWCKKDWAPQPGTDPEQGSPQHQLLGSPECQETNVSGDAA